MGKKISSARRASAAGVKTSTRWGCNSRSSAAPGGRFDHAFHSAVHGNPQPSLRKVPHINRRRPFHRPVQILPQQRGPLQAQGGNEMMFTRFMRRQIRRGNFQRLIHPQLRRRQRSPERTSPGQHRDQRHRDDSLFHRPAPLPPGSPLGPFATYASRKFAISQVVEILRIDDHSRLDKPLKELSQDRISPLPAQPKRKPSQSARIPVNPRKPVPWLNHSKTNSAPRSPGGSRA